MPKGLHSSTSKVGGCGRGRRRCDLDIVDNDALAGGRGDANIHVVRTEAARFLEEIVVHARGRFPGIASVRADLQGLDG